MGKQIPGDLEKQRVVNASALQAKIVIVQRYLHVSKGIHYPYGVLSTPVG